jgi:hypothetical protein
MTRPTASVHLAILSTAFLIVPSLLLEHRTIARTTAE